MTGLTPEQLKEHQEGLGGSDALAYAGLDIQKSLVDLYREKIEPPVPQPDNPRKEWGRRLEPVVIGKFQETSGRVVSRPPAKAPRMTDFPFMLAHLDGVLIDSEIAPEGLEVKTGDKQMSAEYGEVGTDAVPIRHVCQVMHYMLVIPEIRRFHLAVLLGGNDYRQYVVEHDEELARMLLIRARGFWEHVQARVPPDPFTLDDCKYVWPASRERQIKADDGTLEAVVRLADLRKQERMAGRAADEQEVAIKSYMGDSSVLIDPNSPVTNNFLASWRSQDRTTVNLKQLEADHPDLVARYRVVTSHRVFRIR